MQPADQLEGMTLPNGWTVTKRVVPSSTATGGNFGTGYIVKNSAGEQGYLKAMDYWKAFAGPNTSQAINIMTDMYLFEKNICELCRDKKLKRVVRAIDHGTIQVNPKDHFSKVEYLIFELADGDIRGALDTHTALDLAFTLRALHQVAVGLHQLHSANVAHQDLKPSNVLMFGQAVGSKLGDLGRAWAQELSAPHDGMHVAGDPSYAPIDMLWRQPGGPLNAQTRYSNDMYHFGSLIVFLFCRVHLNALVQQFLDQQYWPMRWSGDYASVLPFVQSSFSDALLEFGKSVPAAIREPIVEMVKQLCDPDPDSRGHPGSRVDKDPYSLIRYISKLDRLATLAESQLLE